MLSEIIGLFIFRTLGIILRYLTWLTGVVGKSLKFLLNFHGVIKSRPDNLVQLLVLFVGGQLTNVRRWLHDEARFLHLRPGLVPLGFRPWLRISKPLFTRCFLFVLERPKINLDLQVPLGPLSQLFSTTLLFLVCILARLSFRNRSLSLLDRALAR